MTPRSAIARLLAIAVLAVVGYQIVARSGVSADVTAEQSATLSETTRRVVRGVNEQLRVTAFFPRDAPGRVEAATLLSRYRDLNRKITFRILSPEVAPGEADRLGVQEVGNAAVEAIDREEVEVAQYAIEIDITSAIARLIRNVDGTVCFASGHDERSISDDGRDGLAEAAKLLRDNGYDVETIDLVTRPSVPRMCDAVVAAAPDAALRRGARRAIASYLEASGKLFALADPDSDGDLSPVTRAWGVTFLGGVVVEGDEGAHLPQDLTAPIVTRYAGGSPVVRGLGPTFLPRASGLERVRVRDAGLTVTELATTSDVSYLDRGDFEAFDPDVDREGPVTVGIAADDSRVERPESERARIARTRVLAWGDVDFASNAFLQDGSNADLWLQGIDWLTQPEDLVTAVPRFPRVRELGLTEARSDYVRFLMAGVVPGLFLIAGAIVWVVRRPR
jgi:ABC-type uncharacterized transport system involved in gliding motility auxiliary subunit